MPVHDDTMKGQKLQTIPSKSALLVRKDFNPGSLGLSAPWKREI